MVNRNDMRNRNMLRRMGHRKAGMTRAEWLQKAGLAAAGVGAAAVGLGGVAHAEGTTVTYVYPSDDPMTTIQQKLDGGGVVVFKQGIYTLQDKEFFRINKNVVIKGEKRDGLHLTKIVGGLCPFRVYDEVTVSIEDFWFDQSRWTSILIPCGNVTVKGNKSTNGVPEEFWEEGGPFLWNLCFISEAVWMYSFMEPTLSDVPGRVPPGDPGNPVNSSLWELYMFVGEPPIVEKHLYSASILDNEVDASPNGASYAYGIAGHDVLSPARITVSGNTVTNYQQGGIWLGGFGSSTMTVANNLVEAGIPEEGSWPSGIAMYDHLLLNGPGKAYISNNTVRTNGGDGIYLEGTTDFQYYDLPVEGCVLSGNTIHCTYNPNTIFGSGITSIYTIRSTLQSNTVRGSDGLGIILLYGFGNTLIGNNLGTFTPLGLPDWELPPAHVLLLCDYSTYLGNNHWVLDGGEGNIISGVTKSIGRLTQEQENRISDAMQRKKFFKMKI